MATTANDSRRDAASTKVSAEADLKNAYSKCNEPEAERVVIRDVPLIARS